ncbi:methyltransferase domain-containing protein [Schlesneria paludicola]|uniref:methyltransferase domain-containing protein n=1 Tax=Schlesneria paludicola TaxID=360056 RepID=UPI00029A14A7|nr:methyltransferase domain-containing protein [Schlesneria paludicola]
MSEREFEESRDFWNRVADDWRSQVGDDGDENRRLNSDPVLWAFVDEVRGLTVLDAGCGTGYLTKKLSDRGARVTGIDFSERMIAIARDRNPDLQFQVDSCSELHTIPDNSCDLVVSNYVLMDVPDFLGAIRSFHRVLKRDGQAVIVFSHPCFPQGCSIASNHVGGVVYDWDFSYFQQTKRVDPPWPHFTSEFIWFHRPLSDYWKAFVAAGFAIVDFEEPRVTEDRYHLASSEARLTKSKTRPYSVAFKLQKRSSLA